MENKRSLTKSLELPDEGATEPFPGASMVAAAHRHASVREPDKGWFKARERI
jgi:hypothetical protein